MKEIGTVILETERFILRRFKKEDAEDMYNNWASDPEVCKYLTWDAHKNVSETKEVVNMWVDEYKDNSYNWVAELKETGEIIGNISAVHVHKIDGYVEMGYCYGRKYWNKGYGSEILRKVIEFFINDCGCHLVEALHMSENPASGRVMEKAGMKKEAVLRDRAINKETHKYDDVIVYSITEEEL